MNDSFNSPNHHARQHRDLSLNNDILNDSMRSEAKPHAPSLNGYNVDGTTTNKRPSMSIQSTPKGEQGTVIFTLHNDIEVGKSLLTHLNNSKDGILNESLNMSGVTEPTKFRANLNNLNTSYILNSSMSKGRASQSPGKNVPVMPKEPYQPKPQNGS